MSRYIGSTATVQPTQASAGGVYTLKDQLVYNTREQWPVARDPYFNYTTLLLQGDVPYTRGRGAMTLPLAYNSDASTNNFLITPNGDVGPRPFSPYFGGNYSVYFNGSSDYLSVASNAVFAVPAEYTVEFWAYMTAAPTNYASFFLVNASNGLQIGFNTASGGVFGVANNLVGWQLTTTAFQRDQWVHIAVTRDSSNVTRIFYNGVLQASGTLTTSYAQGELRIANSGANNGYIQGYVSNMRYLKGTALYTTNFTPPTQSLQNITNTSLLVCQSNRFIDNSTANSGSPFTVTVTSTPRITDNSPFVSTDFTTGAGYFDGSDYLTAPSGAAVSGTGAFTVEFWVYLSASQTYSRVVSGGANQWTLDISSNGEINYGKNSVGNVISANVGSILNVWTHVAIGRNGSGAARMWVNGTATSGSTTNDTNSYTAATVYIGSNSVPGNFITGYLSNVRITNTDVYGTSNSTIPVATTSLPAVTGTQLLTLQTRAPSQNISFLDSSPNEFLITKNGNTTQGTFSPFSPSGWSIYFNGSSSFTIHSGSDNPSIHSWLLQSTASENRIGTIEAWINLQSHSTPTAGSGQYTHRCIWGRGATFMNFGVRSDGRLRFYWYNSGTNQNWYQSASGVIKLNTWHHVAAVFTGGNGYLYVDGVLVSGNRINEGTDTGSTVFNGIATGTFSDGGIHYLGQENAEPAQSRWLGYISNFHIVNGTAKYISNFTPASSPLSVISNTKFLFANQNRFIDLSVTPYSPSINSTPSIQAFSPFAPQNAVSPLVTGGSGYFDGSGDTVTMNNSIITPLTTMTIEGWFYINSSATLQGLWGGGVDLYGINLQYQESANQKLNLFIGTGAAWNLGYVSNTSLYPGQWYHIAYVRSGTTHWLYINGIVDSSINGVTNSVTWSGSTFYIGVPQLTTRYYNGYVTGFKVSNIIRYTGNFTSPTMPFTSDANTILLLNFTNAAAVDATGRNVLESVGNVHTTRAQAKWNYLTGGSSMYFDGSDYLQFPTSNPLFYLGSGNWTIEGWFYATTVPAGYTYLISVWGVVGQADTTYSQFVFRYNSSNLEIVLQPTGGAGLTAITGTGSGIAANTWQHLCAVRNGNNVSLYINGTSVASTTYTSILNNPASRLVLGAQLSGGAGATYFTGYMQDVRITNFARYTSNFNTNLPTAPFPRG